MEIITTHKNADFDALASLFASTILYPEAKALLPGSLNPNVRAFLSMHKDHFSSITWKEIEHDNVTRLVVVDTNKWDRLDGLEGLKSREDLDIELWDHHDESGDIKSGRSCHEKVGSTTTLLTRWLREKGQLLSPIQATLFLAGIYEDTGNLSFPSTTAEDARSAAFLLEQKADLNIIKTFLRPVYGPAQKDVLFEMIGNGKREKVNGYSVSLNSVDITGYTPGLSLVVDMYRDIMNVDAAFGIFREIKRDICMVIGRSSVEGLDIGSIMRNLGGGGHPYAGSALVKSTEPEALQEWISDLILGDHGANIQLSDLMSFPVFTVSPEASMKEAALLLREKGCTGLPVVDGERIVGIISRVDFKKVGRASVTRSKVKSFMTTKVISVNSSNSVIQAVRLMVKHDIGRIPVLDDGRLIGIITRTDTMRYYYDLPSE